MSSGAVSSPNIESVSNDQDILVEEDHISTENNNQGFVTSHLYLKPVHSSSALDKQVVLRRIRHRKRVNQVRTALQSFLGSSSSKSSAHKTRWVDDPFAAP